MKKANFYWIIAAFCILRMVDVSPTQQATVDEKSEINKSLSVSFSTEDIVVSGRWMR